MNELNHLNMECSFIIWSSFVPLYAQASSKFRNYSPTDVKWQFKAKFISRPSFDFEFSVHLWLFLYTFPCFLDTFVSFWNTFGKTIFCAHIWPKPTKHVQKHTKRVPKLPNVCQTWFYPNMNLLIFEMLLLLLA